LKVFPVRHPTFNFQLLTFNHLKRWLLIITVIVAVSFQSATCAAEPAASPWNRIVVIGASASAGFVLSEPFGGTNTLNCKLRFYLNAAITAPHAPLQDFSSALMFLSPVAFSQQQVEAAIAAKPTLVIGVDFLFWSCYGDGMTDAQRLQRFESGLKLLEKIPCALVVGDIPDASAATNTGIISADQVANASVRAAANTRLKQWAASRPHVAIVPLANFMSKVAANQAVTVHGQTFAAGKTRAFLQSDGLHPTPPGAALLTIGILDALVNKDPEFSAKAVRWSPKEVYQLGYERRKNSHSQNGGLKPDGIKKCRKYYARAC
jgi:hypothetical protein